MKRAWLLPLWFASALAAAQPAGDPTPLHYRNPAEEARFHALADELRCVQCQNQSLADSNAQIAQDLRREILVLMQKGHSDAEIKHFLVERYGEFVLYRPLLESRTWLLWFGPLALLLTGIVLVVRRVRRQPRDILPPTDDSQEW